MAETFLCVDFGSTWTKAHLVDADGSLVGFTVHRTTIDTDVMDGFRSCVQDLAQIDKRAKSAKVLACSSAGGGLRVAVVGTELLVTAEAGQRVAMSSGGRVVHVAAGNEWPRQDLQRAKPDLVLLVGGTDGGNAEVVVQNAHRLSTSWRGPVVVACNSEAQAEVSEVLTSAGISVTTAMNVMPRIGELEPLGAREAIREVFLEHVIGGKGLSNERLFKQMVRGPTPDVVLSAVELLSLGDSDLVLPGLGELAVVDIGGATTDVYSVVVIDAEDAQLRREVVATTAASRTVEGDLGMRWTAASTVRVAAEATMITSTEEEHAGPLARQLERHPGRVPTGPEADAFDEWLCALGIGIALRRHAGRSRVVLGADGRVVERSGKDLRNVATIVASGGAVRHAHDPDAVVRKFLSTNQGWQLPESPRVIVDERAVLSAAGLLAMEDPEIAFNLLVAGGLTSHASPGMASEVESAGAQLPPRDLSDLATA